MICSGTYRLDCVEFQRPHLVNACGQQYVFTRQVNVTALRTLAQVEVGDRVLAGDDRWTPVLGWLHREPHAVYWAVVLNGHLNVSPHHLLRAWNGSYVQARHIHYGLTMHNGVRVYAVDHQRVPAPTRPTPPVALWANGWSASCYAHVRSHWAAHAYVSALYDSGLWQGEERSSWFMVPYRALLGWLE